MFQLQYQSNMLIIYHCIIYSILLSQCFSLFDHTCENEYLLSKKVNLVENNKYSCHNRTSTWKSLINGDFLLYPHDPELNKLFPYKKLLNLEDLQNKNVLMVRIVILSNSCRNLPIFCNI